MKTKYFIGLLLLLGIQSCSLDKYPLASLPEETFWNSEQNAELALTACYRGNILNNSEKGTEYMVNDWWSYHGLIMMEHLSDNAFDRRGENNAFFKISSGALTADNSFIKNYWDAAYKRIGYCNRFLQGAESLPESAEKERMIAEVRFLRAVMHFYLASYFKDVPLVTKVLTGEESNNVTKTPAKEVLSWCATELTESANVLPRFSALLSSEKGRACKQAALAFLGRVYMQMQDWSKGAETYAQIISLGDNDIHPVYKELFIPSTGTNNTENIFYIQYLAGYFDFGMPAQGLSGKDGGWSLINPTADLFEAYQFTDGTDFSYNSSLYSYPNLGKNRDPRLDYTIYYNGAIFMGTEYVISPDGNAANKEKLDYATEASKTGFMMRKYFDESSKISDLQSADGLTPVIRYAEVLLSYLECLIESGQTITTEILENTINKVRSRGDVHMPDITEINPDALRTILRNERRVELAMEGIRYWDLMRWGIAHEKLSGDIWGASYPNSAAYSEQSKKIDPTGNCRWYVGARNFRNPTDYTWPIPQSEQNINPNLR